MGREWAPGLLALVAEATFSARGFRVVTLQDQGRVVQIDYDDTPDMLALMSTLGGMTTLAGDDDVVKVLDRAGQTLLDVEVAAFREASEASPKFKDLAILAPFFSNAARTTGDQRHALLEWLTVMANQVMMTALEAAERADFGAPSMLQTADRLGYVIDFARARAEESDGETKQFAPATNPLSLFCLHSSTWRQSRRGEICRGIPRPQRLDCWARNSLATTALGLLPSSSSRAGYGLSPLACGTPPLPTYLPKQRGARRQSRALCARPFRG